MFHFIFPDLNWPWVTEIVESEFSDKRGWLYSPLICESFQKQMEPLVSNPRKDGRK